MIVTLTICQGLHSEPPVASIRKLDDGEDIDVVVDNLPQNRENYDEEHSSVLFSNRSTILVPSSSQEGKKKNKKPDKDPVTQPAIFTTDPRRTFNLAPCDREEKVAQRLGFIAHHYWKLKRDNVDKNLKGDEKKNYEDYLDKLENRVKRNLARLHIIRNTPSH